MFSNKTRIVLIPCGIFVFTQVAVADSSVSSPPQESQVNEESVMKQDPSVSSWRIFGGVGSGAAWAYSDAYSAAPGGSHLLLNAGVSYQIRRWEFETGIGWLYSVLNGSTVPGSQISIHTRAGLWDLSARYRIGSHLSVGPVVNVAFGTDTSFSPTVTSSAASTYVGIKGAYEFKVDSFPIRAWAQISTDTAVQNTQTLLTFIGIQFGIPLFSEKHTLLAQEKENAIVITQAAPEMPVQNEYRVLLDPKKVFFDSNSSKLKPEVAQVLSRLGSYLKENYPDSEKIQVLGYSDQRGRYEYNLRLSKQRAASVKEAMVEGGIDPLGLDAEGFSYSKLLDSRNNPQAWAKNRRVEIVFDGIMENDELKGILEPLMGSP